jgi:D-glycero-D-manno-heptose 1,7-bisphosphate phosphatase
MRARFETEGAPISGVYHCPYHPEYGVGRYRLDSFDRKPQPGMLLRARDELGLDLAASVMIGDTGSDMLAARRAGVSVRCLLVAHSDRSDAAEGGLESAHTHKISSLREALPLLGTVF